MLQALVIEDDPNIAELLAIHLRELPAQVSIFNHGWQGLDAASTGKFDFLILDLMLPGLNGIEICRRLRQNKQYLPIIMLTSRTEEQDKVEGLEIGADDYLTKPFSPAELMARVRSILRRTQRESKVKEKERQRITRGDLVLEPENRSLRKGKESIDLTAKEYELLQLFMLHPGKSFTRHEILDEVWGEQFEGMEHTVNSHINRLRAKIETLPAHPTYILTAWGIGYKFAEHLQ